MFQEVELGEGSVPAEAIDVGISHCRVLRIQSGAFRGGPQLRRVHVSSVKSVVANEQAFHNLSAPSPSFVVSECENVVFESHAFKNSVGPLSVSIDRCRHVRIKPNVFTWLLKIEVKDVKDLVLSTNSFNFEAHDRGKHGPATQVRLIVFSMSRNDFSYFQKCFSSFQSKLNDRIENFF